MDITRERQLSEVLQSIGVPSHIKGYRYIKEAVSIVLDWYQNEKYDYSMTKELYPEIARACHSTSSRVERAIRHAVESAFDRGLDELEDVFKGNYSPERGKPTNAEFIARLAEYVRFNVDMAQKKVIHAGSLM